jgi:hypothetical protein
MKVVQNIHHKIEKKQKYVSKLFYESIITKIKSLRSLRCDQKSGVLKFVLKLIVPVSTKEPRITSSIDVCSYRKPGGTPNWIEREESLMRWAMRLTLNQHRGNL